MTLDEIYDLIATSSVDDWNVIGAPLSISSARSASTDGRHDDDVVRSHDVLGVYRPDVDIAVACGHPTPSTRHDQRPKWAEAFADRSVEHCYADVLYRGAHVDRDEVVIVDGGRGVLPAPETVVLERKGRWVVSSRSVELARVCHWLGQHAAYFDEMLQRAGFETVG